MKEIMQFIFWLFKNYMQIDKIKNSHIIILIH